MDAEKLRQMAALKLAKRRNRPSSRHSVRSNRSSHSGKSRTSQSAHLQVLSAVNGSSTVSSTSLQSVGNGVGRMSSIGDETRLDASLRMGSHGTDRPIEKAKNIEMIQAKPRSSLDANVPGTAVIGFNPSTSLGSTGLGSTGSGIKGLHPGGNAGLLGTPQLLTAVSKIYFYPHLQLFIMEKHPIYLNTQSLCPFCLKHYDTFLVRNAHTL